MTRPAWGRSRPWSWHVGVFLAIGLSGCTLPSLDLLAPGQLPDLVGVFTREREAIQVGTPEIEGDTVLIGQTWPDDRLGWRVGDPFAMPLSGIQDVISLADVAAPVWAVLSREYADRPNRWYGVYIFEMGDALPATCVRLAIIQFSSFGTGDTRFEGTLEQLRTSAGALGANALHLSEWEDPETDQRVKSALFGPDWDYSSALALRCPDLSRPPGRSPSSSGDGR